MYGIIYKAIEEYTLDNFSSEILDKIKTESGSSIHFSIIDQPYDDALTYKLAESLSYYTSIDIHEILLNFGEYLIKVVSEKYPDIMEGRGNNLIDYLINLPNFHNRIMLIYPELTPPEFRISNLEEKNMLLHYFSNTDEMKEYVRGYLNGLMKAFNTDLLIEYAYSKHENNFEDVFKISW